VRPLRPLLLNTLSFWLWAMALLFFGLFAATATQRLQADLQRKEDARFVASTQQAMELWERQVLDATATWLASFETAGDLAGFEQQAREEIPWVDSFYLWDTRDGSIVHPTSVAEPPDASDLACITGVEQLAPVLPPEAQAFSYLGCLPAPPAVEVLITARAALLLLQIDRPEAALRALEAGQTPLGLPLDVGLSRGIPAPGLARWRLLQIELQIELGELDLARAEGLQLGDQITALAGPQLGDLLDAVTPRLLEVLQDLSTALEISQLTSAVERTQRRSDAWFEVQDRLSRRTELPDLHQRPQLLRDPYGSPPYLLLFRRLDATHLAAAVQVDEAVLVERLLQVVEEGHGAHITVLDGSGRHLAGPMAGSTTGHPLTFPLVFEYLRVNLVSGASATTSDRTRLVLIQLLPIGLTVLLGTLALLARTTAIRRRLELETSRSEFVTRVTHELKTPLAGIRVMAEAIELGAYRNETEHTELAQRILKESERLAKRVDEVLNMSRAPADFSLEPTDIEALCHEVAERWGDLMDHNDISLELNIRPMPTVMAQRALIRDALGALLENAIKYRDPTRPSRVRLEARPSGRRWLVFEVVDNGIGVPPAKRKRIFEPFARVEGPGRGRSGGHGLGLSFVSNAARVHRGRAECREGIEGGSRFILRIRR
jgi:signal transduction histidine kinase